MEVILITFVRKQMSGKENENVSRFRENWKSLGIHLLEIIM
jgi:hypothetical protein